MDEIDEAHGIRARPQARAFARVEDQHIAVLLETMSMGMAMQEQVDVVVMHVMGLIRIVHDENPSLGPFEGLRWVGQLDPEAFGLGLEQTAFAMIVVAEHGQDGNLECGELAEHPGLGDVTGVHHAFDLRFFEERNDSFDVGHSIVGVSHDANSHPGSLPHSTPGPGRRDLAMLPPARGREIGRARAMRRRRCQMKDSKNLETMIVEKEEGILTVTLNRPDRLNAFTVGMMHDWFSVLDSADEDDDVRAIIVTGAGRGFCAGADLGSGAKTFDPGAAGRSPDADEATTSGRPAARRDEGGRLTLRLFRSKKPLIAAVNGPAVGVGVTSILPMDIRLASQDARFGFVFARRGIVPEAASSWFLPRVVGINQAMEWVATGRVFDAQEALRGGLVSEVLAPDALLPRARELAREIADSTSSVSVALARQMMWQMLGAAHPMEAHRLDSAAMAYMGSHADSKEGVMSFLEKRSPSFPMRVSRDFPLELGLRDEPPYEA